MFRIRAILGWSVMLATLGPPASAQRYDMPDRRIAKAFYVEDDTNLAQLLLKRQLAACLRTKPEGVRCLNLRLSIATTRAKLGHYPEAEKAAREVLAIVARLDPAYRWRFDANLALAQALAGQNRHGEAAESFRNALPLWSLSRGTSRRVNPALVPLAQSLIALNRPTEAIDVLAMALDDAIDVRDRDSAANAIRLYNGLLVDSGRAPEAEPYWVSLHLALARILLARQASPDMTLATASIAYRGAMRRLHTASGRALDAVRHEALPVARTQDAALWAAARH